MCQCSVASVGTASTGRGARTRLLSRTACDRVAPTDRALVRLMVSLMDESSIRRHVQAMLDAEIIAVDTETTGLNVKDGRDYGMGISVAYRHPILGIMSAYFPFRHEQDNIDKNFLPLIETVLIDKPLVFHNLKFDLFVLKGFGIEPKGKLYDTAGLQHFVNEELRSKKLDALAARYKLPRKLDTVKRWADIFGWSAVPANIMAPYACRDAEITLELFEILWPKVREEELASLVPTERRFTRLLYDMEARGVRVNRDFCLSKADEGHRIMGSIEQSLGWKPSSSVALGEFLLGELGLPVLAWTQLDSEGNRTEKSKPSFTKKEMEQYDELLQAIDRPEARLVLEYRGWQKAVSSLYSALLELSSPDGRVRCSFNQYGTKTGRLSCEKPNLQQIPRASTKPWNGDAKLSFLATEGYELYGYDYSQLEFRLAAAYGQERWLLDTFNDPEADVFTTMAERIGVPRQTVKTFTYGTLYGAGLAKTAQTLNRPVEEISAQYADFKASISGIKSVSDLATRRAKSNGFVRYWTGRRRHFPFNEGHHKAFNSLLQGGGAEVVKRAMIRIDDDERIDKNECRIVLQVHDEIVFEIKHGCREKYEPLIREHMTNFPEFGVTLAVDGKVWNK